MSKLGVKWIIWAVLLVMLPTYGLAEDSKSSISIDVNRENPEAAKKRGELLEKTLSPTLIEKRQAIVRQFEDDYKRKITEFLQGITTPLNKNTVIAHVDMHLFDPEFKEQIKVEKDVTVTVILGVSGFDLWRRDQSEGQGQAPTKAQAMEKLRQLISDAFRIPPQHIVLTVGP